jgi:preprotein translocase subunit SecY
MGDRSGLGSRSPRATLVTGTIFLMWLGEQITERGIGNGISIIIFAGIVAGLPSAIGGTLELARTGELHAFWCDVAACDGACGDRFVVFVERGQRRITGQLRQAQQGRRMYAGQSSHLPLKLNMAGVIPPIFASSIILFPATIAAGSAPPRAWAGCANIAGHAVAGAADLRDAVRRRDHLLLLLLYRAGVQPATRPRT